MPVAPRLESAPADSLVRPTPPSMIARMTLILGVFDPPPATLSLEDVSSRTNLPRSSTHRILEQMVTTEWIDHGPDGYRLGRRSLGLRMSDKHERTAHFHNRIRRAAAEPLRELYLRTGMVAHLAAWDEGSELVLDKIGGHFASTLQTRIGSRVPAHCTTGGRAMLAWLTPEEVDRHARRSFAGRGDNSGWDLRSLRQELNRIRQRNGLSFDTGEHAQRLIGNSLPSVATAVRGPDGPVAAICLCADQPESALQRAAPLLVGAAVQISHELFPTAASPRARRGAGRR